jgi:indole-3-glycerol phosphate synthase
MALTMTRTAVTMQVNDDGASREIMDDARDEAELKADKAADAVGAVARAAIADTRVRAEAAVTALRAEIDAADGTHAVTKILGKKGSLSPSGELADALRKPPGTIAIIAQGAQLEVVSLGGFDLDDPVYLSAEFRRGNAVGVCIDVSPEQRLSAKAVKDTAEEQQTAIGEFPGPILVIARDDFVDEVQLAQVAADGATAVVLPLQLNGEEQTGALMAAAAALGLDTLVRVGDEAEVEAAVRLGASCVCFGDSGVRRADELRQLLPEGVVSVSDCELRADEAIRDTWRVRDLGFNAVILGAPLMKTCARERCPPTAVLKAMLAKGSVKFGLGMQLGRMEGAKESLGSLAM